MFKCTDAFTSVESKPNDGSDGELSLQIVLERSKKAIIQGSMELLLVIYRQLEACSICFCYLRLGNTENSLF